MLQLLQRDSFEGLKVLEAERRGLAPAVLLSPLLDIQLFQVFGRELAALTIPYVRQVALLTQRLLRDPAAACWHLAPSTCASTRVTVGVYVPG